MSAYHSSSCSILPRTQAPLRFCGCGSSRLFLRCIGVIRHLVPVVVCRFIGRFTGLCLNKSRRESRCCQRQRFRLDLGGVLLSLPLRCRAACWTAVKHMTDLVLVAAEFKHQCKLGRFCVILLDKNAVIIKDFSQNFGGKFRGDKSNL